MLLTLGILILSNFFRERDLPVVHVLSVAPLRFHSLVAAHGRLCAFRMKLKELCVTWTGAHGNFPELAISTVSSTAFAKVPKFYCVEGTVEALICFL